MKKHSLFTLVVLVLLVVVSAGLAAQNVADVNDPLYTDLKLWEARGLLSNLPPVRPYPVQLVQHLLKQVEQKGNKADIKRAARYLNDMTGPLHAHLDTWGELRTDFSSPYGEVGIEGTGQGMLPIGVSYAFELGGIAMSSKDAPDLPEYTRPTTDFVRDGSVTPIGSTGLTPQMTLTSMTAYGSPSLYIQAGITRSSFGPIWGDSIVLSPYAPQSGVFSFTWQRGIFTYSQYLGVISATTNEGTGPKPSKFIGLHSLSLSPLRWLSVGLLETIVWGDRFDPLYLMPVPTILFYSQGLNSYVDNSLVGAWLKFSLPASTSISSVFYVDDAGFNQLIRLDFNAKLLAAFQTEAAWTPNLPYLTRLSATYTLVTPYMYTHIQGSPSDTKFSSLYNYQNYTNDGQNMGASLQPNSDRIELKALARPTDFLDLTLFGRLIRHGNASEGIPNMPAGSNGTIFDPGWDTNGTATYGKAYNLSTGTTPLDRFLTQQVLEIVLQTGISAEFSMHTRFGQIAATASYTFQRIWNPIANWGNGYPVQSASDGNPDPNAPPQNRSILTLSAKVSFF